MHSAGTQPSAEWDGVSVCINSCINQRLANSPSSGLCSIELSGPLLPDPLYVGEDIITYSDGQPAPLKVATAVAP
jgi:hypothetical protein